MSILFPPQYQQLASASNTQTILQSTSMSAAVQGLVLQALKWLH